MGLAGPIIEWSATQKGPHWRIYRDNLRVWKGLMWLTDVSAWYCSALNKKVTILQGLGELSKLSRWINKCNLLCMCWIFGEIPQSSAMCVVLCREGWNPALLFLIVVFWWSSGTVSWMQQPHYSMKEIAVLSTHQSLAWWLPDINLWIKPASLWCLFLYFYHCIKHGSVHPLSTIICEAGFQGN